MDKISSKQEEMKVKMKKRMIKKNIIISIFILTLIVILSILLMMLNEENNVVEIFSNKIEDIKYKTQNKDKELIVEVSKPEIDSKTTDWELILVNKDNKLPEDYTVELETIEYSHKIDKRAADSLREMMKDARNNGFKPVVVSSYRTHATQQYLYKNKINQYKNMGYSQSEAEEQASFWVAIPGTSEHEAGLALDIVGIDYQVLDEKQEDTPVQQWLMENCYNYGFILRYPTEKKDITKINYEPWHYRYVGIENAKFMKEKGFCLEEYVDYLKGYEEV